MIYKVGDMCFPGLRTNSNADYGEVVIGGDQGDVRVSSTYVKDTSDFDVGVECSGVELHTSIENLSNAQVKKMIRDIVNFSYNSIQGDTFYNGRARLSNRRSDPVEFDECDE
jgi:hypothetical protein